MTAGQKPTLDDYLATEAEAPLKREFVGGEVIAMAGAEPEHNAVREALSVEVGVALRGGPWRSFSADQRVDVRETDAYFYPDLVIVCGPPEFVGPRPRSLQNPTAWFEVLSPTTESWDRGGKFAHARRCASLDMYVLIDPVSRRLSGSHLAGPVSRSSGRRVERGRRRWYNPHHVDLRRACCLSSCPWRGATEPRPAGGRPLVRSRVLASSRPRGHLRSRLGDGPGGPSIPR